MFQLPASSAANRRLRMALAFLVCVTCALLGWHFVEAMLRAIDGLPGPMTSLPTRAVVRALLPGIAGLYLWSVAMAFFLFTVIKLEPAWKQRHLRKFQKVMHLGWACLWFTVPIAFVWVATNVWLLD